MEGNNNNNNQNRCDVCGSGNGRCGRCGNMCGFGGYSIMRWILGIIIITWVFSFGMKFGELKATLNGYDGFRGGRVMPMMGGAEDTVYFSQAVPATGAAGTIKVIKSN